MSAFLLVNASTYTTHFKRCIAVWFQTQIFSHKKQALEHA